MTNTLHGTELLARAKAWEEDPLHYGTDAAGLVALLRHELEAQIELTDHLAGKHAPRQCELIADPGSADRDGQCTGTVVAMRFEDGFSDSVCQIHADRARARGARVTTITR